MARNLAQFDVNASLIDLRFVSAPRGDSTFGEDIRHVPFDIRREPANSIEVRL
ncbi:hypothetical protein DW2_02619 [Thioclava atlantica]|uniref:Uncharacterized protein n=1 Tax=Thioclava atlantica TaxID=1317124 RepID=A0A085TZM1_9RHOB|nr:hypothetical protein DW2_02619 [Thioclava atlantica]